MLSSSTEKYIFDNLRKKEKILRKKKEEKRKKEREKQKRGKRKKERERKKERKREMAIFQHIFLNEVFVVHKL